MLFEIHFVATRPDLTGSAPFRIPFGQLSVVCDKTTNNRDSSDRVAKSKPRHLRCYVLTTGHARPSFDAIATPTFAVGSHIIGGEEAAPGEFPWQLSQQRQGSSGWSHSCGASLLSKKFALSAAHCVNGALVYTQSTC